MKKYDGLNAVFVSVEGNDIITKSGCYPVTVQYYIDGDPTTWDETLQCNKSGGTYSVNWEGWIS